MHQLVRPEPKFAPEGAARSCELRNRDLRETAMHRFCSALVAFAAVLAIGLLPWSEPGFAQQTPPAQVKPPDQAAPFGEEVTLTEKPIIYFKGTGNWDSAFETI